MIQHNSATIDREIEESLRQLSLLRSTLKNPAESPELGFWLGRLYILRLARMGQLTPKQIHALQGLSHDQVEKDHDARGQKSAILWLYPTKSDERALQDAHAYTLIALQQANKGAGKPVQPMLLEILRLLEGGDPAP